MHEDCDFEIEYLEEYENEDLKELDNFLEFAYNEGYLNDILLDEALRQTIKQAQGGLNRARRSVDRKIDAVGDAIIDGGRKYEIPEVRKQILRGRKSISQIIRKYIMVIGMGMISPPLGLVGLITHMLRSGKIKRQEKRALLADLKTELEIIEEKIKDAEADNDRKKKYQYIRLRREIQRGIEQIRYGQRANLERNSTLRL